MRQSLRRAPRRLPAALLAAVALLSSGAGAQARPAAAAGAVQPSPVLGAMRQELSRSMETFKGQPVPPYFISYEITESRSAAVGGAFGTVTAVEDERRRVLDVDLRVGTPAFDNTHAVRGGRGGFDMMGRFAMAEVPLEDDPLAIRRILWYQTDRQFKRAVEAYTRARTDVQLRVAAQDTSPDFSLEPPVKFAEAPVAPRFDRAAWERKIRAYTAPFAKHADIFDGEAFLGVEGETRWYVNSEGSELQTSSAYFRLVLSAYTRADDGMVLPRFESFVASTAEGLPSDSAVLKIVERMIADLRALKKAPVVDAATAPAILSGRASGVLFHEVFGHRIEGHRLKDEDDAQTFKGMVGQRVLPAEFSVYSDPTLDRLGGVELAGHYQYDNQGVKARRVEVVKNGVFRSFLMSRSPIAGFAQSNGHGRSQPGLRPVARQSNLVIASAKPVSRAQLRAQLIAEIKRQGKPWGLIFDDIEGGFTMTGRGQPNAFEVIPVMVYRLYPDGREELVRGVDLVGTPLTVFSRILAADGDVRVFNGVCGAESGGVPVSAVSPGILISQIEVQRKQKSQEQGPILPPPTAAPGSAPAAAPAAGSGSDDVVARAMRDELARSMSDLRLAQFERPYFISYRVREQRQVEASASHGSLAATDESRRRTLSVELRVGDYRFDNSGSSGGVGGRGSGGMFSASGGGLLPLDDDYLEIRRQIWLATDEAYKDAVEVLTAKRAAMMNRERTDTLPDFGRAPATQTADEIRAAPVDRAAAEALVRELSALGELSGLYASRVSLDAATTYTRYLNSEGTWFTSARPLVVLSANGSTQATDGTPLGNSVTFHARSLDALPPRDRVAQAVRALGRQLDSLRTAPLLERYNGPVLFDGYASARLFSRAFAPTLISRRTMGGALSPSDKLEGKVLPAFLGVVDDPTLSAHGGEPLLGNYKVDDEGVTARRTQLVEGGILKTLLATRTPVEGVPGSTGNRRGGGAAPSNLLVQVGDSGGAAVPESELKGRLLALVRQRGLRHGVLVRDVGGGGSAPTVLAAYRVHPDGREELVRAGRIARLSAESFKDVVAVSRTGTVHHATAGGGSDFDFAMAAMFAGAFGGRAGSAVTSYVVPSLLFEDLALTRPGGETPKAPLSPPPTR